ncbi:hypothetical protein [Pseudomonas sp. LRF_L74]|uniref:hypothetical protein n=1 Tax=Pseudomonas sp. LRF_L74 TaxID=3369422 RepID=UPI003F636154
MAIDVDETGYVGVKNIVEFFRFLLDQKLEEAAVEHLEKQGVVDVLMSKQAIDSVKNFLGQELSARGEHTAAAQAVTQCICCNAGCRNK